MAILIDLHSRVKFIRVLFLEARRRKWRVSCWKIHRWTFLADRFARRKGRAWRETFIVNRLSLIVSGYGRHEYSQRLSTSRRCISAESIRYPVLEIPASYRNKVVSSTGNVTRVERFSSPPPILQDDTVRDAISGTRPSSIDRHIRFSSPSPMRKRDISFVPRPLFIPDPQKIIYAFTPRSLPIRCITRLTVFRFDPPLFNLPCGIIFHRVCFLSC